jgi:hypothetical protein
VGAAGVPPHPEGGDPVIPLSLIEQLGQAVDAGVINLHDAAHQVAEASQGGLTFLGARDSLERHRTLRSEYAAAKEAIRELPRGCSG